jgi:peptide chain release factor 1
MAERSLLEKLETLKLKFEEVEQQITDPAIIADQKRFIQLNKEYKELQGLVEVYKTYKNTIDNIDSAKQILDEEDDAELKDMAKMELDQLQDSFT